MNLKSAEHCKCEFYESWAKVAKIDFIWKMRSKDEVCDVKYVCDENIQDEFMSGMKFGWNIRWDEISRETVKWNQKMKSVMQTANEMETEMVKLLCKDGVCDANCRWDENWNSTFSEEYICDGSFPGVGTD